MVNDDAMVGLRVYNGCPWKVRAGKIKELGLDKASELAYLEYDPAKYDMSTVWVCNGRLISNRKTFNYEGSWVYIEALLLDPRLPEPPIYELKYPYILVNGVQYDWDNFFDPFANTYRTYELEFLMCHLGRESVVQYVRDTGNSVPVNLEEFSCDTRYLRMSNTGTQEHYGNTEDATTNDI